MANDLNEMKTMMIGMIGKHKVELEMNCEQMEQLVTTTGDILCIILYTTKFSSIYHIVYQTKI